MCRVQGFVPGLQLLMGRRRTYLSVFGHRQDPVTLPPSSWRGPPSSCRYRPGEGRPVYRGFFYPSRLVRLPAFRQAYRLLLCLDKLPEPPLCPNSDLGRVYL
jgi:hypothetical protein